MIDIAKLAEEHVQNTPRTHDGQGHRIHEDPQCQKDLQAWPCDIRQLLDVIDQLHRSKAEVPDA